MPNIQIIQADLDRADHARAIVEVTNSYCQDAVAAGAPLPAEVCERLVPALRAHPTTVILLAYDGPAAVGIATCFLGFSTFSARQLLNLHDLAVVPSHRGEGVGRQLLAAVEAKARELGCCKVTLEVQENNWPARGLYEAVGFGMMKYSDELGGTLFMTKPIA